MGSWERFGFRLRAFSFVVASLFLVAGCLDPAGRRVEYKDRTITAVVDSDVAPANRTGDEFYFIWISGGERVQQINGTAASPARECDPAMSVEYDAQAGVLRYDARVHIFNPDGLQVLVALEYRGDRLLDEGVGIDCANEAELADFDGRAHFNHTVREDIHVDVVAEPQNGFVTYNRSYFIPMGKKIHVNFTRLQEVPDVGAFYVTGDFEVVNMGLWNRTRLQART